MPSSAASRPAGRATPARSRHRRDCRAACRRPLAVADATPRLGRPPPEDLLLLERPRRLHPRTAASTSSSSTATPRRPAAAAGPVDQRPGQCRLWLPATDSGLGLHLGRQQPDEPADALVQRPGVRPAGRSGLPARRGDGRILDADAAARGAGATVTVRHGQGYTRYVRDQPRAGAGTARRSSRRTIRSSW